MQNVENWTLACFLGIFHPPRTDLRISERSECCLICWCISLNLSLKYSLEDGTTKLFDCVRFYSLGPRPGSRKSWYYQSKSAFYAAGLSNWKHVVMSEKKKLKNLRKFRNGHWSFVRKTIASATELLSGGNPIDIKKLKLFRASLQTKYSELQALDQEIAELLDDVSKIEQDVVESCELSSAIHACILEL